MGKASGHDKAGGIDDVSRCDHVDSTLASEIIYRTVYTADSKAVENLLQADSFVSTVVRDRSLLLSGQLRSDNQGESIYDGRIRRGALHHKTAFI
jgi:hypothetical protein